jgi:hypothetical protein
MGEVWGGFDLHLERQVAVKLLLVNLLGDDRLRDQVLGRFYREGKSAARLNHRNIAAVYDINQHEGQFVLVQGLALEPIQLLGSRASQARPFTAPSFQGPLMASVKAARAASVSPASSRLVPRLIAATLAWTG